MARRAANPYEAPSKKSEADQEDNSFLLSEQPADPKPKKTSADAEKEWAKLRSHLEQRLQGLRTWRSSWWISNWSDLAQYIEPRRSIWLTQSTGGWPTPNNMTRGRPINNSIVDPTGTYAVRVCSSGMMSGLASPSRPWFKIVPSVKGVQIDAEGRAWLDEVEDRIYTILAGSNFYNSFAQECEDLVVFGTGPCIIYEDEKDVIRCYNPAVGEYYLGSSAELRVDCLNRAYVSTVSQIVGEFGVENCPEDIQGLWAQKGNGLDQERIIAHSIEPNFAVGEDKVGKIPGKFTWREVYWLFGTGSSHPLRMKGFYDCPFTAGRWAIQSNDAYGRSPCMDTIGDIIQLQVESLRKAEAIEKMVRPPLIASMDMKNQPSSILPGAVTYAQNIATAGMKPIYETNPRIAELMEDIAQIQARIKVGLFNDILMAISSLEGDRRSATEIIARDAEKLQILGPVIENIIGESLRPKLQRIFNIIDRRNLLPPRPDSMKQTNLTVDFTSMLVIAQRSSATSGMERIAALVGNMVAVWPEAKNKIDVNNYIDTMNFMLNNPQSILRSNEQVAEIEAALNKQMEQEKAKQDIAGAVGTAKIGADAAKVLSDTTVGAGTDALSALLQ